MNNNSNIVGVVVENGRYTAYSDKELYRKKLKEAQLREEQLKEEKSACGKSFEDFVKECHHNCRNIECQSDVNLNWRRSSFRQEHSPKDSFERYIVANPEELKYYRISRRGDEV